MPVRKALKGIALVAALLAGVYLGLILAIFDVTQPAYYFDSEYHHGRPTSPGPTPRWFFCWPSYHGFLYTGEEWPFREFRPFCRLWCRLRGYHSRD